MAAFNPGPLLSFLVGQNSLRTGAAPGTPDHCSADQQAGGAVEGTVTPPSLCKYSTAQI